jgi:hypothetical protein
LISKECQSKYSLERNSLIMKKIVVLILILTLTFACKKIEVYPDEPQISFKSVIVRDSTDILDNPIKAVKLIFEVIDGDGDIGLDESDTTGPFHRDSAYYYNLFIKEYEKIGENFVEVPNVNFPRYFRIPDLTPQGQNKTLKAEITVNMEYRYSDSNPLKFTEFKYFYYLVDRNLNKSNEDTSSLVIF